jgi:Cu(I)/Ag(I) efflux system membrane fusion protein
MSKQALWIGAFIVTVALSFLAGTYYGTDETAMPGSGVAEREILYWVAPMDANYRRDEPGKSPMGMDLVPVYADEVDSQAGVVKIDPTIVNNLGVRTAYAEAGRLSRRIETVGYVGYDEDTLQHVHTRVEGWIEKLVTKAAGDPITKDQLLFELYSPTLVNAQQEYLAALRSGNTVLQRASEERLDALGVTAGEIDILRKDRRVKQRIRVYAPTDGVIAHLGVAEGEFVTSATDVMSIAELDKIWVLAEVFERQASWVKAGQHAMVELDYLPGQMWHGTVDYVYPELDPKTRTLKVRLRFDNADEVLRPNMFARVTIHGDSTGEVVHIPREALIRGGSVDRVVIALGDGRFRSQPVRVGAESGDRVAILEGISAGDPIIVSGQFLIDSESNIESALSSMEQQTTPQEHSQHNMEQAPAEPMDHSQHDMEQAPDEPMDHSQHDMEQAPDEPMDHSQHDMESSQ